MLSESSRVQPPKNTGAQVKRQHIRNCIFSRHRSTILCLRARYIKAIICIRATRSNRERVTEQKGQTELETSGPPLHWIKGAAISRRDRGGRRSLPSPSARPLTMHWLMAAIPSKGDIKALTDSCGRAPVPVCKHSSHIPREAKQECGNETARSEMLSKWV